MIIKDYLPLMQEAGEGEGGGSAATFQDELARLSASEGSYEQDDTEPNNDDDDDSKTPENEPEDTSNGDEGNKGEEEYKPTKNWDLFKEDEGFVMPEGITAETEDKLFRDAIAKKFGIEPQELHPLAKQIQTMTNDNPNLTINDIVNSMSIQYIDPSKMSVDEKISFDLFSRYGRYDENNNPDGLTDEDVSDYISKLSKIQKNEMSKQIEANIEAYNKELTNKYEEQQKKQFDAAYDDIVNEIDKYTKKLSGDLTNVDKVYGIPVSQEEHEVYLKEFKEALIPNKESRRRPIDQILSDDMTLYKMFLMATKFGEEKVIEAITQGKETAKKELFEKLKITPQPSGSRRSTEEPNSFEAELALLGRPEM